MTNEERKSPATESQAMNTTIKPLEVGSDALVSPAECEWDDAKFRHAYTPSNRRVALCGYDGPSTWKNEWTVPENICPICIAILPEHLDLATRRWIKD